MWPLLTESRDVRSKRGSVKVWVKLIYMLERVGTECLLSVSLRTWTGPGSKSCWTHPTPPRASPTCGLSRSVSSPDVSFSLKVKLKVHCNNRWDDFTYWQTGLWHAVLTSGFLQDKSWWFELIHDVSCKRSAVYHTSIHNRRSSHLGPSCPEDVRRNTRSETSAVSPRPSQAASEDVAWFECVTRLWPFKGSPRFPCVLALPSRNEATGTSFLMAECSAEDADDFKSSFL